MFIPSRILHIIFWNKANRRIIVLTLKRISVFCLSSSNKISGRTADVS